jgi:hypothetical protein
MEFSQISIGPTAKLPSRAENSDPYIIAATAEKAKSTSVMKHIALPAIAQGERT